MKGFGISHLIYRLMKRRDDGRRQRLGHITDSQTDNLLFRMLFLKSGNLFRNIAEQVTARQLQIIFIDCKHVSFSYISSYISVRIICAVSTMLVPLSILHFWI